MANENPTDYISGAGVSNTPTVKVMGDSTPVTQAVKDYVATLPKIESLWQKKCVIGILCLLGCVQEAKYYAGELLEKDQDTQRLIKELEEQAFVPTDSAH